MKSFLVLSLAASALAWPTPEEIFARATTSQFCKKVKTGCGASLEKNSVQKYCESVLGVPPQKTKTFTNLEWETVWTSTKTEVQTEYTGSGSFAAATHTQTETITATDARISTHTSTITGGTTYAYPSQCGAQVAVGKRQAAQPACLNKYASKGQQASACSCVKLTATVAATSLVDITSTTSLVSTITSIERLGGGPTTTETTTLTEMTLTETSTEKATVTGFALKNQDTGLYAYMDSDVPKFTGDNSQSDVFTLDSNGNIFLSTNKLHNDFMAGNIGSANVQGGSADYVRFGGLDGYQGAVMTPLACSLSSDSGTCSLVCEVGGFTHNCLYDGGPTDGRNGGWVVGSGSESWCRAMPAPVIAPAVDIQSVDI